MSLSVSIASISVNYKVNSWQVVNSNDLTKTCSFVVEDAAGTTRYTHRMPVVCSDSTNGVLFAGFIDEPDEANLYPNAQNEISITCMDYRSLALKRRPTKDYTNMQAGDVAIDMVSNYLAAEGVTAGYAYRHISTDTEWNTGTLSGAIGALNVGDGDLELSRAGTTVTKTFSTTTDWNTGTLTSIDAQNNMLNLHASNALKYTGTSLNLGNCYAYWEFWAGSYTIASGDMLQYDVWISSTSPEIKAAVDLTMSDGNTMRDFSGQACHDNYNIHAHPGSDLKGFADDQWYSRTVQLTALNGKTASFATIAFEGDSGGSYTAYFKNIKIVNSSFVTQVTLYDGTSHPYQPYLVAIGQNYVVGNNGYVNLAVSNATVYEKSGTWTSAAISIDAAKLLCTSLINWTSRIPSGATAGTQTSGSNAPATPAGTTISIYTSIDNKATWQAANFKQSIPNLDAGFNIAGRNLYLKAVLAITNSSPEVSPILKSLTSTITSSWTQTKTDSSTTAATQTDFNTGNYTGAGWQTYLSGSAYSMDNGVSLAGYIDSWDYAATLPTNITLYSTSFVTGAVYLNRKQLNLPVGTGTDIRARVDAFGSNGSANYQNFSAQVSFSFPDVSVENGAGLAYRTTNWGNNNDSYAYAASMITNKGHGSTPNTGNTVLELSKGTNSTGAGGYTNLGSFTLPFTPSNGTTYTLKIVINGSSHKLYIDDVLYLTVTDATYSAAGQIAVRYYNNTGVTQTAILDNFGVVALQPSGGLFTGTWDNGSGIALGTGIGTVGNSLIAWDADEPSGCTVTAQTSINGGSTWQTATNGAAIPNLPAGTLTNGKSVQVKFTLTSTYPSITPVLKGWTIWLTTQTSAQGTRISPALAIAGVGRIGSTSVTLNSLIPTNTSVLLHASFNAAGPWTSINLSVPNGNDSEVLPVSLIYPQPDPVLDFFASDAYQATILADTPIRYYRLDETAGTTAIDSGSQGANATLHGGVTLGQAGLVHTSNTALLLDGTSGYLTAAATGLPTGASAWSVECWIKPTSIPARNTSIVQFGTSSDVYLYLHNDGTVALYAQGTEQVGMVLQAGTTYYLCGQYDGSRLTLYVGDTSTGILHTYGPSSAVTLSLGSSAFYLGNDPFAEYFPGTIDEGAMYNYALTSTQITTHYTAGSIGNPAYTSTHATGGQNATWTFDTTNHRLTGQQVTSTKGLLFYTTFVSGHPDILVEADVNTSDTGGLLLRAVDANNFYFLSIHDSASASSPNTLLIRKAVANAYTTLATATISFTRGDYHRFRFSAVGSTLTAFMDNVQIATTTDTSFPNAGQSGFHCGITNGNLLNVYSLRIQNLGENHDGQSVYTRLTLNSTDPTATPQLQDITTSVHSTAIGTGALIPQTDYAYKNTCGASFDDLASQSTTATNTQWQWDIDQTKAFSFHHAYANPAPFYVWSGTNGNISWGLGQPGMQRPDMRYRNRQIVKGGLDTSTTETRSFVGDGQTQTWTLPWPVDSVSSITVDGASTTIGVRGTDTGKDFYYLQGDQVISQDSNGTILARSDTLTVSYVPQKPVLVTVDNTGVNNSSSDPITVSLSGTTTISQLAAITGDSGIVEDYIEVSGLSKSAAIQRAKGLLQQYGVLGRNITFTVKKFGLAPGQLVNVTMPQHGIYNGVFLISKITIKAMQAAGSDPDIVGGILYSYTCEATEGSTSAADWRAFWTKAAA